MSPPRAALAAALAAACATAAAAAPAFAYVVTDAASPAGLRVVAGTPPDSTPAVAWGSYDGAARNATGWAVLDVHTNATLAYNDTTASYAAGLIEGVLTVDDMADYAANTGATAANGAKLQAFLDANWAWMTGQAAALGGVDPFWASVGALVAQLQGLADGQARSGGVLTFRDVYQAVINGGDIFNLAGVYGVTDEQLAAVPKLRRAAARGGRADHCSALVRLLPGAADLLVSHTTWAGFEGMTRILKRYDMPLPGAGGGAPVPGRWSATSGYPAMIGYSSDDFYVLGSGLVTLETTIDNSNASLALEYASPFVVLEWARNLVANRLATDGASWAATFARAASGTYTNSWMVVDTNRFTPGAALVPGTLTVVEEMPGHMSVVDRTAELAAGFWPSYNVPSDPAIFNVSGQWALVEQYGGPQGDGAWFTYANTSRARIFARDAPGVVDEATLRRIMRYNKFQTDPLSTQGCGAHPPSSATNAIADRSDLNDAKGDYVIPDLGYGDSAAIDAKYTLASWVRGAGAGGLPLAAQAGPTYDDQAPFSFSASALDVPHAGMVDTWKYEWVRQPW